MRSSTSAGGSGSPRSALTAPPRRRDEEHPIEVGQRELQRHLLAAGECPQLVVGTKAGEEIVQQELHALHDLRRRCGRRRRSRGARARRRRRCRGTRRLLIALQVRYRRAAAAAERRQPCTDRVRGAALASRSRRAPRVRPRASAARRASRRRRSAATISPWCVPTSTVLPPTWGVAITVGMPSSGWSEPGGSTEKTSSAAPPRRPPRSASISAASSTSAARAVLTRHAPGFMRASAAASIIPRVSSLTGACRLTKSLRARSVSRSTASTPSGRTRAGGQIRVVHDDGAAEAGQPRGDAPPHRPEADQADRLPPQLTALQAW